MQLGQYFVIKMMNGTVSFKKHLCMILLPHNGLLNYYVVK